jgi:ligand-binding sensor domain-containing protein
METHITNRLVLTLFVLLGFIYAESQNIQEKVNSGSWVVYNTSNSGIPGNYIQEIINDHLDRKYFASGDGLGVLDGSTWTIYNPSNSEIPNGLLRCLEKEGTSYIWVGTVSGLGKFNGTTWTNYFTGNSGLPDPSIDDIAVDQSSGVKWIATDGGLARFDDVNWTVYDHNNTTLSSDWFRCIAIQGNVIWTGMEYIGLARLEGGGWSVFNTSNSDIPSNTVHSLAVDPSNGHLWVGTYYGGVADFDGINWTVYNKSNSGIPSNSVRGIAIDAHGVKWFATGAGLARFDGTYWTTYNTTNSGIPGDVLHGVMIDSSDVWVATDGDGAAVMRDGAVGFREKNTVTHRASPNPFTDQVVIELSSWQDQNVVLKILEITGREIFRENFTLKAGIPGKIIFNGSHLSRGMYSYFISSDNTLSRGLILKE